MRSITVQRSGFGHHFDVDDLCVRVADEVVTVDVAEPERVIEACADHEACGIVSK